MKMARGEGQGRKVEKERVKHGIEMDLITFSHKTKQKPNNLGVFCVLSIYRYT